MLYLLHPEQYLAHRKDLINVCSLNKFMDGLEGFNEIINEQTLRTVTHVQEVLT